VDRRTFLIQAGGSAASVALPLHPARAATPAITATPVAKRLTLLSGGGGNVVVFDSPEGVLLVDGGSHEASAQVLQRVRALTGSSAVHTLFNTHWHWEQTGSNASLGARGTRIIAHENTRLWLSTDVELKWQKRTYPRLAPAARPTQTFYTSGAMDFGGEHIEYGYLPQAHTDGDIYVYFRHANVLVAGDVLASAAYPIIDYSTGGWIGGLATGTQTVLDLVTADTKIIAGLGPVLARADVAAEHEMLVAVKQRLSKLLSQGMSVQDMIKAAPTQDYDTRWGNASLFIANAFPGLVNRARELGVSIV
jgi:glyoxylase-like metal-dependent hydrolase (beta-lactamase superfamily II)